MILDVAQLVSENGFTKCLAPLGIFGKLATDIL
jgi:hypothetical protein